MARRKKHEDHLNHEAWAIPYGDWRGLIRRTGGASCSGLSLTSGGLALRGVSRR